MCSRGYANKDFSSVFQFLREEEGQWMGGVAIHADICTTYTPQCPLSHYAQEKLWARPEAQICEPINILYVDTCPLIALANSYFLFKGLPLHGRNAKIDLRSVSRDTIWVSLLQRGVENEEEEVHIYVYWCYRVVFKGIASVHSDCYPHKKSVTVTGKCRV